MEGTLDSTDGTRRSHALDVCSVVMLQQNLSLPVDIHKVYQITDYRIARQRGCPNVATWAHWAYRSIMAVARDYSSSLSRAPLLLYSMKALL
jgi:hypothetical protein